MLIICDHASAKVPEGIDLGVGPEVKGQHMASDLGAGPLASAIAQILLAPCWLANWSRLVCDLNRPTDVPALIPEIADGYEIPGNQNLSSEARAERLLLHSNFHENLTDRVTGQKPLLLVSVHSFTPRLQTDSVARPWPIGILWNKDRRAAEIALELLAQEPDLGGPIGDNEPYSGKVLNYTMDRHAEANGIPYLGIEVRQDLLGSETDIQRWADILARVVDKTRKRLELQHQAH